MKPTKDGALMALARYEQALLDSRDGVARATQAVADLSKLFASLEWAPVLRKLRREDRYRRRYARGPR